MKDIWGDIPTWLAAIGTCGAVITSLWLARSDSVRRERKERRQQAELVTAWPENEEVKGDELYQAVIIQNSSSQSVYTVIASLVSIQGAFRSTAVPPPDAEKTNLLRFQRAVGQVAPGKHRTLVRSGGHGMNLKLAVEIAFRDASGVCWLRRADGRLEEIDLGPVDLYRLNGPIGWEIG